MAKFTRFTDRTEAGVHLAEALRPMAAEAPVVLGLPRGGLPVAREVARELDAPLDVVVVRKIGAPGHREFAIGAIGEGGVEVLSDDVMARLGIDRDRLRSVIDEERRELRRRVERYRGERVGVDVTGRTVIVVDDGIATGRTARAACQVLRARGARRIVLAVPVAAPQAVGELEDVYDEVVALHTPRGFMAVGSWYANFGQTTDEEVERILAEHRPMGDGSGPATATTEREDQIDLADVSLPADVAVPPDARGVVVFAHGSGSSRRSPRNRQVAAVLQDVGMATVLFDLLTEREAADRHNVFDIPLLAQRVAGAIDWILQDHALTGLPVGVFGASTGAAAALEAAAARPDVVGAVVSRGGRADMSRHITEVRAPVLLVVGGEDTAVIEMNRQAADRLSATHELVVVPGAGHLFEGPGQLEDVARRAASWFRDHLDGTSPAT